MFRIMEMDVTVENLVSRMLEKPLYWQAASKFAASVIRVKAEAERRRVNHEM